MTAQSNNPILDAAVDMLAAFSQIGLTPVVIGGVAVSGIATPRFTEDLDALIIFDPKDTPQLLTVLDNHGFTPRFELMADHAIRARMITVTHDKTGTTVDIAFGCMPFEEELLGRSTETLLGDVHLHFPSPEDLVIMKAIANRPKDHEDIRNIAATYPGIDRDRIKYWIEQYGELLDDPTLWRKTDTLLNEGMSGKLPRS